MKKSFIALAVAGAVVAPMTASAVDVTYSGTVNTILQLSHKTDSSLGDVDTAIANEGPKVAQNDVQFGLKATEDVGFAEAFGSLRIDVDSLSGGGNANYADNVAVGLSGDFGVITLGEATDYAEKGQLGGDGFFDSDTVTGTTPNASLSYGLSADLVPGLSAGLNLITTTYDGINETSGLGYGVSYMADFGDSGALDVGFGANTRSMKDNAVDGDSIDATETTKYKYQSVGLKYTIAGIYLAFAQQTAGQELDENPLDVTYEDVSGSDIQLGYSGGPLTAYYAMYTYKNYYAGSGADYDTEGGDRDLKTTKSRIHVDYKLSDAVTAHFRRDETKSTGQNGADATTNAGADMEETDTMMRVGMGISF